MPLCILHLKKKQANWTSGSVVMTILAEVESSRTSLASRTSFRTRFEVLGLEGQVLGFGLEASSPGKLPCPTVEVLLENAKNLAENLRITFLFSFIGA